MIVFFKKCGVQAIIAKVRFIYIGGEHVVKKHTMGGMKNVDMGWVS